MKRKKSPSPPIAQATRRGAIEVLAQKGIKFSICPSTHRILDEFKKAFAGEIPPEIIDSVSFRKASYQLTFFLDFLDIPKIWIKKKTKTLQPSPWGRLPDTFFDSKIWQKLRYETLVRYGSRCMCCHTLDGTMHVDHIKPRSKYPELALDPDNLQVLCEACNMGKGNWDETDWREDFR